MAKKIQLAIPEPCHENWNDMTPVDKGRFCGSCQKQVVDFSNMSDREVAQFFKKPSTGSVCGRFMQDQLNRDMEIPKKRIPWIKYFFQIALPAFLLSAKVSAQRMGAVKQITKKELDAFPKKLAGDKILIPDLNGKSLTKNCFTEIMGDIEQLPPSENKSIVQKRSILEDTIVLPEVTVVAMGFTKGKVAMGSTVSKAIPPPLSQLEGRLGGVMVGVKVSKEDSLFKKVFSNFFMPKLKTYPNPVIRGASLNIEWSQTDAGNYNMQIISQGGQLVYSRQLWIDADAKVLNVEVPSVAAGTYFLRMIHKASNKSFTEKIVIQ